MSTRLLEGHSIFRADFFEGERELFDSLARGVHAPTALLISCCDARVVPNLIVNADPGDLFIVRNIANLVPPFGATQFNRSVGAAIEYAVHYLKVPHIVVCGHTQCGGIKALVAGHEELKEETPTLAAWLEDAIQLRRKLSEMWGGRAKEGIEEQLIFENVVLQLEHLLTYPVVKNALEANRLEIHGWVYDLTEVKIQVYDPASNQFREASPGVVRDAGE